MSPRKKRSRRRTVAAAGGLGTVAVTVICLGLLFLIQQVRQNEGGGQPQPVVETPVSGGWYTIYFSRPSGSGDADTYHGGLDDTLAASLATAQRSLDIAIYEFDRPSVAEAVVAAHQRGVAVRLVTDTDTVEEEGIGIVERAGIPVVEDDRSAIMHDKFIVMDGSVVWTGSMNYTTNDIYRNDNNLLRITSTRLAANYAAEFAEMFEDGQFGTTSPDNTPNPQISIDGTLVETLFAAEGESDVRVMELIRGAQQSVEFMAFTFTHEGISQAMIERAGAGVQVGEVEAGFHAVNFLGHHQGVFEGAEHGALAHRFGAQGGRVARVAQFLHAAAQARQGDFQHFFRVAAKVGTGVEDDVGGPGQVAVVRCIHEALAALGPFFGVGVEVDEVGGVDGEGDAGIGGGLLDRGAGFFRDTHRAHPGQFERAECELGDALHAAYRAAGFFGGGDGRADGSEDELLFGHEVPLGRLPGSLFGSGCGAIVTCSASGRVKGGSHKGCPYRLSIGQVGPDDALLLGLPLGSGLAQVGGGEVVDFAEGGDEAGVLRDEAVQVEVAKGENGRGLGIFRQVAGLGRLVFCRAFGQRGGLALQAEAGQRLRVALAAVGFGQQQRGTRVGLQVARVDGEAAEVQNVFGEAGRGRVKHQRHIGPAPQQRAQRGGAPAPGQLGQRAPGGLIHARVRARLRRCRWPPGAG